VIYRIAEDNDDPAATTFTWGKFVASGEAAEQGGGFACADNLLFDPEGNLWMVTDITTPSHNFPVDRTEATKTNPGGSRFPGVFGNNALFMIPTKGPAAGVPFCFAIGPMECEMTGPTFTEDGKTLILAIQHPGELNGTRGMSGVDQPTAVVRDMKLASRDGTTFAQSGRCRWGRIIHPRRRAWCRGRAWCVLRGCDDRLVRIEAAANQPVISVEEEPSP
jgi:secreted PhoX family phosphatase